MELKVIKSGDKDFEREKAKLFEEEQLLKKRLAKEEQLKKSFKILLTTMLETAKKECFIGDLIDCYANLLIKEVTIRVKL